jgi:hypothetical protein
LSTTIEWALLLGFGTVKDKGLKMRYLFLLFFVVSGYSLADAPKNNTVNREKYERVIEQQYPGFRIMREEDFIDMYKGTFRDGKSGSLLFGHFDSDENLDFAAFLIGAKRKFWGDGITPVSSDEILYDGAIAICHGDKQGSYICEKMVDTLHGELETSEIVLVPRGSYECMKGGKDERITTPHDFVGKYSESGGSIYVRQPDGKYKKCVTSD